MAKTLRSKYDLDTPALIIDLDALEHNVHTMASYFETVAPGLRPHVKTHKMPAVTRMQVEAGAIGATCQTLGEAEVFAQAGVGGLLITSPIANDEKVRRLVGLSRWADVTVTVDSLDVARAISEVATDTGTHVKTAVEMSTIRCGLQAGEATVEFVGDLVKLRGLEFKGIWTHEAGASADFELGMEPDWSKRKEAHFAALDPFLETKHMLERAGIPVEIFSAGYTATYDMTAEYPEVTDVQAGSYVFMDWPYRQLEGLDKFRQALTVLTTVISIPPHQKTKAYTDCGIKNISSENTCDYALTAFPRLKGEWSERLQVSQLSEEHGHLEGDVSKLRVGDKLELVPSHCCTVPARYDVAHIVSGEKLVGIWEISARGRHG
jgi:D-serine deaminase-like pyridoxal phosphate-dependent protein